MRKWKSVRGGSRCLGVAIALLAVPSTVAAQTSTVAEFVVHAGGHARSDAPVTAPVGGVPLQTHAGALQLYEVTGGTSVPVQSQLRPGNPDQLTWILAGNTAPDATRRYELRVGASTPGSVQTGGVASRGVRVADDGESLQVEIAGRPVLAYRYAQMPVPPGVRDIFSLSGFIHPLWSPQGEVLTRIQPPDHYHHYGIWNPWTSTEFEGRSVDFWNIGSGQGRVRSEGVIERTSGDVFGGFRAIHDHVDNTGPTGAKVALREQWEVTVWNAAADQGAWVIDFTSTLNPVTDDGITIKAYRYQGFSLRATERWNDTTARLLTSEGFDKGNANATRARWIDVNGVSDAQPGTSGVLFMSNPSNYNFPEQLRIWPVGQNGGVENVYINFNPAQEQDWVLEPGRTYGLKYRMFVYDGRISAEEAERLWISYSDPPVVEVRLVDSRP